MAKRDLSLLVFIFVSFPRTGPGGAGAQEPSAGPVVKILYPAPDSTLPAAGFLQTYLAAETNVDCLCRYATSDVAFDAMAPFTNSSTGRHHTHHVLPERGKQYRFYIRCQDVNNNISPPVIASFAMAESPNGIPANLIAGATSSKSVLLFWTHPDPGKITQFRV